MDETSELQRARDAVRPAPAAPGRRAGVSALLDRTFGAADVVIIRHAVRAGLISAGFGGDRLESFVLAINEIITNVVLHAGGAGRVVLRGEGHSIWCTVTDSGPGIPAGRQHPPAAPEALDLGGRGIWLAERLCDEITMATGPIGTTIGLRMSRPGSTGC